MFLEYRGIPITFSQVSSIVLSLYIFYEHVLYKTSYTNMGLYVCSDTSTRQSVNNITDGEIMVKENYFLFLTVLTQLQENYFREEV